ncbi:DUF1212-domain-containing protein [Neoconidiobolus thromboides FSU 785]|nr:DUF1212-domain-containing protein [Neoconidiobolus thromboides FSU 785]
MSKEISPSISLPSTPKKNKSFIQDIKQYNEKLQRNSNSYKSLNQFFGIQTIEDGNYQIKIKKVTAAIESLLNRQKFLIKCGQCFIQYGAPSHRLESNLKSIANVLDLNASFFYLPNLILICFHDSITHTSETHLITMSYGYNMDKLNRTLLIYNQVIKDEIELSEAINELDIIVNSKNCYPPILEVLAYGIGSFALSPIAFQGNWVDAGVSFLLGIIVGLMSYLCQHIHSYSNVLELTSAIIVSFIACCLNQYCSFWSVVIPAIFNILPGLSLTIGMVELASKNIICGTVRIFYALLIAFMLGFGLSLGTRLYLLIDPTINIMQRSTEYLVNPWFYLILFPLASLSFNMYLLSHPKQWFSMAIISLIPFLISYFCTPYIKAYELIPALSGFSVGLVSNLYARFGNHLLPIAPLLSSILLIVPGSLGVKGSSAFFEQNSQDGANFALQMIIISLSITMGLLISTVIVFPNGRRRSTLMTI